MRLSRSPATLVATAAALALLFAAGGSRAQEEPAQSIDEAGWQGVLGVRAPVSTAQRYIVLLKPPSLAARVRAAGGRVTESEMLAWSAGAVAQQEQFLARLAAVGARIASEYRYTRVVNGFSARLDPTSLALLDRDREVVGIYPVRIAYPAQASESGGVLPSAVADLEIAGLDGTGVTVALLDTGRRSVASVPPAARALRRRRDQPGEWGDRAASSHDPRSPRTPRDRARRDRRRHRGPGRAARDRSRRIDPANSRRRLAGGLRGWVQRLLAHRPDPGRPRGGRRPQRRRGHARRGSDCAHRDGGAVRRVRRRAPSSRHRGRGRSRHAHDRSCRQRRSRRPRIREHRRPGRGGVGDHGRRGRRAACRAHGAGARPSGAASPLRGRRAARWRPFPHRHRRRRDRGSANGGERHHRSLLRRGHQLRCRTRRAASPCLRSPRTRWRRRRRPVRSRSSSTVRFRRAPSAWTYRPAFPSSGSPLRWSRRCAR